MKIPPLPRRSYTVLLVALLPCIAFAQPWALTASDSTKACPATPAYPPAAQRNMATGTSLVRVTVDTGGAVVDAHLLRPSGVMRENALLDDLAVASARKCLYAPNASAPGGTRRGVVVYDWRIDGLVDDNPYATGLLASLRQRALQGDASAAYWLYLRSDPAPNAAASVDALHWLSFAADHGMAKARQELDRLHAVGEDAGLIGGALPVSP